MIDAYEIGARITLSEDIIGITAQWAEQVSSVQSYLDNISSAMRGITSSTRSAATAAGNLANAYGRAADAAERIQRAAGGGIAPAPFSPPPGGAGGGGGGYLPPDNTPRLPGPDNSRMPGTGLSVPPNWTPGQRDPIPFPTPSEPFSKSRGISGHDIYGAMFAGGIAAGGISAFATSLGSNVEAIQKPRALLIGQGVPASVADQMVNAAQKIQQTQPGVSFPGALQMIYDTYTVTKNAQEAMEVAPQLAQSMFALHEIGDDAGGGDLYDLVKAAEIKGTLTTKNKDGSLNIKPLMDFVDAATKVSIATGGKFQPSDAFRIAQNAGPIFKSLDENALTEAFLLSNELGPSRVGTGLQGFGRQLVGGKMSKQQAQMFASAGLLDIKDFHPGAMGYGYVNSGGWKDQDEIASNPFQWINDKLVPAILKAKPGDREAIIRGVSQMFSTVPGQRLAITDILSQMSLDRQTDAVNNLPSVATTNAGYRKDDPGVALAGFENAFSGLMTELGSPLIGPAVSSLKAMTDGIDAWANSMKDHPAQALATDAGIVGGAGAGSWALWKLVAGRWAAAGKDADDFWEKAINDLPKGSGGAAKAAGDASFLGGEEGAAAAAGAAASGAAGTGLLSAMIPVAVAAVLQYMMTHPDPDPVNQVALKKYGRYGQTVGPTGKPGDPLHVVVTGQGSAAPGPQMPTAQTGHNPIKAPPMPGQVFTPP